MFVSAGVFMGLQFNVFCNLQLMSFRTWEFNFGGRALKFNLKKD